MEPRKHKLSSACRRSRPGFSLTEILIAMGILGIGLVMVAALFPVALDQVRRGADWSKYANIVQSALSTIQDRFQVARGKDGPLAAPPVILPELAGDVYAEVNWPGYWLWGTWEPDDPRHPWPVPTYFHPIPLENAYAIPSGSDDSDYVADGSGMLPYYRGSYETESYLAYIDPFKTPLFITATGLALQVDYGDTCWPTIASGPEFTTDEDMDFNIRTMDDEPLAADELEMKWEVARTRRFTWHAFARPGPRELLSTREKATFNYPWDNKSRLKRWYRATGLHQWEFLIVVLRRDTDDVFLSQENIFNANQPAATTPSTTDAGNQANHLLFPAPWVARLPVPTKVDGDDPSTEAYWVKQGMILDIHPDLVSLLPPGQMVWLRSNGTALRVVETRTDPLNRRRKAITFTSDVPNWQNQLGFLNSLVDPDGDKYDAAAEIVFFPPAYRDPNPANPGSLDYDYFADRSPVLWYARRTVNLSP